jgi:hypothetical protein
VGREEWGGKIEEWGGMVRVRREERMNNSTSTNQIKHRFKSGLASMRRSIYEAFNLVDNQ